MDLLRAWIVYMSMNVNWSSLSFFTLNFIQLKRNLCISENSPDVLVN